jgi:hypothetical protein
MPPYKAGQEIDGYCTKCKMDLLHRIVAVGADGQPAKAECRTCHTTHVFRRPKGVKTPGGAPIAAAAPTSSYAAATGTAPPSAPRARKAAAAVAEAPLMPPDSVHIHLYKMTERFAPESWVQHKTFGVGRVMRDLGGGKIEVRFEVGVKVLVHGVTP